MPLISKLTNCSSSLNFSSVMFSTKVFESLIKLFLDVLNCCNYFDKSLPILYTAEFSMLITSLIFNRFFCIFNNGLAEGVFGVWSFKFLHNFSLINPFSLSSFNFSLTLDLTLFILYFLSYIYSDYPIILLTFTRCSTFISCNSH